MCISGGCLIALKGCASDAGVHGCIVGTDELLKQSAAQPAPDSDADEKRAAFREILEYGRRHPFPKDFDWEKAREEAMIEKYGRFD